MIATSLPLSPSHLAQVWKLVLAYDGTDFHGWQVQPGKPTIQGTLANALLRITGEHVLPQGSGRTDAGVHAEGQVVSLQLAAPIPADRLRCALNRRLPAAIRVLSAEPTNQAFHARSDVVEKTYEYRIFPNRSTLSAEEQPCPPWQSRYVWDCRWTLDLQPMQEAAAAIIGTHDYTSFAAHDPDRAQRIAGSAGTADGPNNVRTISVSSWQQEGDLLRYRVCGNGFLHHMVRNLVGTLVEVGAGRRDAASLTGILAARDRRRAGMTAPPQGLFLMDVQYRESRPFPNVPAEAIPAGLPAEIIPATVVA